MALTVTSRGTGTHNTGATTLVPGGRSATLAVGSMGVLCIALDNAGTAGSATIAPSSWTDAKGNIWTLRLNALYDNGIASTGVEMAIYTAPITVALLTTDLGTITWLGPTAVTAKVWTWYEVIPSGANTVAYKTNGSIAGATAANATVVTASCLVGDAVIAGYFSENVNAVTGDSDSTNGSWTAQQTATVGSGVAGLIIATQQKVQTTTPSTQSYDVTVASQDRIAGYVMFHEVVNTTVTPSTLALTLTTFTPTVTARNNKLATPTTLALTVTKFAPTVQLPKLVTPPVKAIALATFAPTAAAPRLVTPPVKALSVVTFAPTVTATAHQRVTPTTRALTIAVFVPTVAVPRLVTPGVSALAFAVFAPSVSTPRLATPPVAGLVLATFAPSVSVTDHKRVTPATASLTVAAFAPTVTRTDHQVVTPTAASLTLLELAPVVVATANRRVIPPPVALLLTEFAPLVSASVHGEVIPLPAQLTITRYPPTVVAGANVAVVPPPAELLAIGHAPVVLTPINVVAAVAVLVLAGFAPSVVASSPGGSRWRLVLDGVEVPVSVRIE